MWSLHANAVSDPPEYVFDGIYQFSTELLCSSNFKIDGHTNPWFIVDLEMITTIDSIAIYPQWYSTQSCEYTANTECILVRYHIYYNQQEIIVTIKWHS